ncbi:MAG: transglutaminase domain-containing protein [Chloroflexi bacterium]|nr:MAG: transglutaminase domain-containing protein [Chloroflexota bacterium]MBL1193121.1 transglutaminase domain-containing protein [Chloroflexota bacterium]NOH10414.1 transglutaminase domain-containing protein [Chloroflexota bacterium]
MPVNQRFMKFQPTDAREIISVKVSVMSLLAFAPALILAILDLIRDAITFPMMGVSGIGYSTLFLLISLAGLLILTSNQFANFISMLLLRSNMNFFVPSRIVVVASVISLATLIMAWGALWFSDLRIMWISYGLILIWWTYIGLLSVAWIFNKAEKVNLLVFFSFVILAVLFSGFVVASGFQQLNQIQQSKMITATLQDPLEIWRTKANVILSQSPEPTIENLIIAPHEDQVFLQSVLDIIFPSGIDNLEDEEIAIAVMQYVTTTLELKSNQGNATKILQDGYAICGGMSVSFTSLLQLANLPTRYIGLFGLPYQGSHAVAEVYYDDKWHMFDPTFGLFYYSSAEYDQSGEIASLEELASSMDGWHLFKVVDEPWGGSYVSNMPIVPVEDDYLLDFHSFDFVSAHKKIFVNGFPFSYGQAQIMSFPLEIDFTSMSHNSSLFAVGIVDKSNNDIARLTADTNVAGKVGNYYLGGGGNTMEMLDTLIITTESPGYIKITYYGIDGEQPPLALFPLKAVQIVETNQNNSTAEFWIRTSSTQAILQLFSSTGEIFWIDAIEAEWLGEEPDFINNLQGSR